MTKPNDWKRIERNIKVRADFRCECGTGYYDCDSSFHYRRCPNVEGQRYPHNKRRIGLRVVQVGPPDDWRPRYLVALCLPCYQRWEKQQPKVVEQEQESMFDDIC